MKAYFGAYFGVMELSLWLGLAKAQIPHIGWLDTSQLLTESMTPKMRGYSRAWEEWLAITHSPHVEPVRSGGAGFTWTDGR